jgi:hypothetical protein
MRHGFSKPSLKEHGGLFAGQPSQIAMTALRDALHAGGYALQEQVPAPSLLGRKKYRIDFLAQARGGYLALLDVLYQDVTGTAEQKVPFFVIDLIAAVPHFAAGHGYVVMGGDGYTLAESMIEHLPARLVDADRVTLLTLEVACSRAASGSL